MLDSKDDRSLGELFADLARESSTLLRQEVQLAKTELSQKASALGRDVASVAIGGLVAYAGLLAIVAALIIGLAAAGLPWWVAALLVGLIVIGIGYGLIQRGLTALKRENFAPQRTIESLQEDARWAKEQVR
jgi:fatty acid desaturase